MSAEGSKHLGDEGFQGRLTVSYGDFVPWLIASVEGHDLETLKETSPLDLFDWVEDSPLSEDELIQRLSEFCGIPRVARIEDADVEFKTIPRPFCEAKLVVPVRSTGSRQAVVLSNPFDWETLEDLERTIPRVKRLALLLATPTTLRQILGPGEDDVEVAASPEAAPAEVPEGKAEAKRPSASKRRVYDPEKDPGKNHPVAKLAVKLLSKVLEEDASHLVVESRGSGAVAKATIGGRAYDLVELPLDTGKQLVARFKALSGMDLAKKRTPQTGSAEVLLGDHVIKLRLSTSPDATFENLTIRVLDPSLEADSLEQLGLTGNQAEVLRDLAVQDQGLILFVGPLGSGKTTTIYSLLASVADESRSVTTVEDPIEHMIPFATQMEVGPEAGRRQLLKRAVSQGPDVLFLSEIQGLVSAQTCVDFSAAGHLALTSMDSSNAATAVFRLDRLGVDRSRVADVLIGVVAQRILKRLCPDCKEIRPTSREEAVLLKSFTGDIPETVAHPVGCSHCRGTGYLGQEGVFEVITVGPRMSKLIRDGRPIAELREFAQARGDLLVGDHAIRKVREHLFPVKDVYREVLLEEGALSTGGELPERDGGAAAAVDAPGGDDISADALDVGSLSVDGLDEGGDQALLGQTTILVVEDEESTRFLVDQILAQAGYKVLVASDGAEALLMLGTGLVDLVLSDIHMPNLDGLKLLEILKQHDIDTPVILLTGEPSPHVEARGREMGVADYLRKPVQRDILLERIWAALGEDAESDGESGRIDVSKKKDRLRRY